MDEDTLSEVRRMRRNACLIVIGVLMSGTISFADGHGKNLDIALDAARDMVWPDGNRAYMLMQDVGGRAPVSLIFGYADNHDACREIADDLSRAAASRALGTPAKYICEAVE